MQPALLPRRGRQAPRRAAMQPWSLKYVPPRCGIAPGGAAAGAGCKSAAAAAAAAAQPEFYTFALPQPPRRHRIDQGH